MATATMRTAFAQTGEGPRAPAPQAASRSARRVIDAKELLDRALGARGSTRYIQFDPDLLRRSSAPVSKCASVSVFAPLLARAQAAENCQLKRTLDLVGAVAALVVLLPVLLLIALAVWLDGRGPILFRQQRYGAGRTIFTLYKFRTMTVLESAGSFSQAHAGDKRVTRIGRLLRCTSLDELPQLINVVKGEMSLVGPRPHAVAMDDAFAAVIDRYRERHLVRPGLTGLAQVLGYRGPTDALAKISGRIACDRAYIRRWSVLLDIKIMLRTPGALLGPECL